MGPAMAFPSGSARRAMIACHLSPLFVLFLCTKKTLITQISASVRRDCGASEPPMPKPPLDSLAFGHFSMDSVRRPVNGWQSSFSTYKYEVRHCLQAILCQPTVCDKAGAYVFLSTQQTVHCLSSLRGEVCLLKVL
jgi:hypothetical protein